MNTFKPSIVKNVGRPGEGEGFTLIEVLLTVCLLAIGILAIASMQVTSIRGNAFAKEQTERSTWAQDKLEELLSLDAAHSDLEDTGSPHSDPNPPDNYTITWTVDDDTPVPNSKLITVTVTGSGKTVQMACVKPAL